MVAAGRGAWIDWKPSTNVSRPPIRLSERPGFFEQSVQLPKPSAAGWEAEQRDVDSRSTTGSAGALRARAGRPAVLSLARLTDTAGYIGKALYDSGLPALRH